MKVIWVFRKKDPVEETLVDDEFYEELSKYRWGLSQNGYVRRAQGTGPNHRNIYMHHEVLRLSGSPIGRDSLKVCDHVDRNRLNNCFNNLREATVSQNRANSRKVIEATSKYLGVSRYKHKSSRFNKWQALIKVGTSIIFLGHFFTEEEAARAYDAAAREHFGEFANLNF